MDIEYIECLAYGKIRDKTMDIEKFKEYLESLFGGTFVYYKQIVRQYKPDPFQSLFGKGIRTIYNQDSSSGSSKAANVKVADTQIQTDFGKLHMLVPEKHWQVDYIGSKQDEISDEGRNIKILIYRNDTSFSYEKPNKLFRSLGFREM